MTRPDTIVVERMGGADSAQAVDEFRSVYAEVFAEPPYGEGADDVGAVFRRFPSLTRNRNFRGAIARTGKGGPVGMAYGHAVPPDTGWWDELTEPVPETLRREDGHRTFGLKELAVRGAWRGLGVARLLHEALLDGIGAERVLLNVHPDGGAAAAAYRSWGYRKVGEARPWQGPDLYDVMLLELRS